MSINNETRTDPDAILSAINKRSKKRGGKLHIFLGMAPGVGKTYAMLLAAHEAKNNNRDVVVGVVETHGRKDTGALILGLEIIPKKSITHRGIILEEMDIDAILLRKPQLVLVDELAHTNAPTSRHLKRWQDVFELLDAGIDVLSTLNVQHLDSRKESVEQITKITVRETVPDSVIDRASQIQLIDLSPQDLLKRLKEGKVYLGDKAEVASQNFFKEERLTALREIALRLTAERVDSELKTFVLDRDAGDAWAATNKLMVVINHNKSSEDLLRATRKLAYNMEASWIAIYVTDGSTLSEPQKLQLVKNFELAENLGAQVINLTDLNITEAIIRAAQQNDVTQIVINRPSISWFKNIYFKKSVLYNLLTKTHISIIVLEEIEEKASFKNYLNKFLSINSPLKDYNKSIVLVLISSVINYFISSWVGYRAIGYFFLLTILFLGLSVPIGPVLIASILSAIIWDYFFVPPIGTFIINSVEDVFMCISFVVAAIATGILARRITRQQEILLERETRTQLVHQIAKNLAYETTIKGMILVTLKSLGSLINARFDVLLAKTDGNLFSFDEKNLKLTDQKRELAVAKWAFDNKKMAGRFSETLSSSESTYFPLVGPKETVGVLVVRIDNKSLSIEDINFLSSISRQLAVFIEREKLRKIAVESIYINESYKFLQTVIEELSKALNQNLASEQAKIYLENLFTASRITSGINPLRKEQQDIKNIINETINKISKIFPVSPITIESNLDLPVIINAEIKLIILSFINILIYLNTRTNTQKPITINLSSQNNIINILIIDENGPIEESLNTYLFERTPKNILSDNLGLGLWIAKNIIKAHEGKITPKPHKDSGLSLEITLPY